VVREKLRSFIGSCFCFFFASWSLVDCNQPLSKEPLLAERDGATRVGRFHGPQDGDSADLSPLLEDTMQLRKAVPLELVVNMFRKLVRCLLLLTADDDDDD
jgi:hypothetical protein